MPSTVFSHGTREQLQEEEYRLKGPYHWGLTLRDYGWMKHFVNYTNVVSLLQAYLHPSSPILDLGCGDGYCTSLLTKVFLQVSGVDSSERAITFARERVPQASFFCGDARTLSFTPHSFQGIACVETLEHMPFSIAQQVVTEAHRMLKPGGVFVATVPSDRFPVSPKHYVHFNPLSFRALLSPFRSVHIEGSCRSPTPLFDQLYRLSSNKHWHCASLQTSLHGFYDLFYGRCSPSKGVSLLALCKK